jgi:hypothetical protein
MKIPSLNKAVAQILATDDRRRASGGGTKLKFFSDPVVEELAKREKASAREPQTLEKAILKTLNGPGEVERLAFESDPSVSNKYHSLYKAKTRLIPDKILKRIAIQDDLVASIVQARCNHLSAFARPRPDRFSTGYVIEALQSTTEAIESIQDPKERQAKKEELQRRIARASNLLLTCGEESLDLGGNQDVLTFPQYVWMSVRNAITVGRIATEILYRQDSSGEKKFAAFRVIDAGTIYKCEGQRDAAESVRRQAKKLLSQLKNDRLVPERYENDEYAWVQVIEDRPVQAFTADECLVHNFYPVPDYELDGYPVTPLDTVISAVTTHLNITSHNKLYFQSGRAARGMLVFRSDDVDEEIVARVRQQFNAQINSTTNAWRMPVFGIGSEDEISWQPIDNSSRDMEFQYLMDMNARVIMSAFAISPEEMPGWSYLSRGTNNQSLSEGNNEYKLEAARDVGIRPLLSHLEDFLNQALLPKIDPYLAKLATIKLVGLDAETAEKESVRISQDMAVHMTQDEILEKVEKKAIGRSLGGEFPLSPAFQAILDKYVPVGVILEEFFDRKGASKDPQWQYVRDSYWFNWQQMLQQQQQMQMQQQQMAAQQQAAAQGAPPPQDGESSGGGQDAEGSPRSAGEAFPQGEGAKPDREENSTERQKTAAADEASASPTDLTRSIDQALLAVDLLSKSEKKLPPSKRALLNKQKGLIEEFMSRFKEDATRAQNEIIQVVSTIRKPSKA